MEQLRGSHPFWEHHSSVKTCHTLLKKGCLVRVSNLSQFAGTFLISEMKMLHFNKLFSQSQATRDDDWFLSAFMHPCTHLQETKD